MGQALLSRVELLRGRFEAAPAPVRPPWALAEPAFLEACTRCDDCRLACPEGIIQRGRGGYPEIDFRNGECTFCGDCATACETGAIGDSAGGPWHHRAQIGDRCLARQGVVCRLCEDQCAPRALRFRPVLGGAALPEIDDNLCSGCGACVAPCPTEAITMAEPRP